MNKNPNQQFENPESAKNSRFRNPRINPDFSGGFLRENLNPSRKFAGLPALIETVLAFITTLPLDINTLI